MQFFIFSLFFVSLLFRVLRFYKSDVMLPFKGQYELQFLRGFLLSLPYGFKVLISIGDDDLLPLSSSCASSTPLDETLRILKI